MRRTLAGLPTGVRAGDHLYDRWNRWSRRGLWHRLFASLSAQGQLGVGHVRLNLYEGASSAHGGKRGAKAQAIGVSRGGQTTKIHAVCDLLGRPVALTLTPGNTSDIKAAELLKEHVTGFRRLVADRGYDANQFRGFLKQAGTIPSSLAAFTASGASAKTNNATRVAG